MVIAYILLLIATVLLIEVFQGLRDFQIVDANTNHYINVTNPLPEISNQTLTSSIRKRVIEVYGSQYPSINAFLLEDSVTSDPKIQIFYQKYMQAHINKLSKVSIYPERDNTLRVLSLNSEWMHNEPYSNIALYTLAEDRLFQVNTRTTPVKPWRFCSYQHIWGAVEATSYDRSHDLFAATFHDPTRDIRFLVYYESLDCDYKDAMNVTKFKGHYCDYYADNDVCSPFPLHSTDIHPTRNRTFNTEEDYWNILLGKSGIDVADSIAEKKPASEYIELIEDTNVLNLAVTKDLMVYTTYADKLQVSYVHRGEDGDWLQDVLEYPMIKREFRFFQNLGLGFIADSGAGEKQLLIVDLFANETKLELVYFVYKFATGEVLLKTDGPPREHYKIEEDAEIDPKKLYASALFDLHRSEINQDLTTIDIMQGSSIQKSIIKTQFLSKQTAVLSLQKYFLIIGVEPEPGMFSRYSVRDFEDQTARVKDFDISENGHDFAFLTYNKEKMKVFIMTNKAMYDIEEDRPYLVNFDYSMNSDKGKSKVVKEVKLIKTTENDLLLMLLLEAGEVATFSLQFGVMSLGGLSSLFLEDQLDFLSLLSVVAIVLMFLFMKIATSTRFQLNLRPGRAGMPEAPGFAAAGRGT